MYACLIPVTPLVKPSIQTVLCCKPTIYPDILFCLLPADFSQAVDWNPVTIWHAGGRGFHKVIELLLQGLLFILPGKLHFASAWSWRQCPQIRFCCCIWSTNRASLWSAESSSDSTAYILRSHWLMISSLLCLLLVSDKTESSVCVCSSSVALLCLDKQPGWYVVIWTSEGVSNSLPDYRKHPAISKIKMATYCICLPNISVSV